jgi:hypothetical protein
MNKWRGNVDGYYALLERGKVKPDDHAPEGIDYFSFYLDAYNELSTCKTGMGNGPIPLTAIIEYSKIVDVGNLEDFIYLMRQMDEEVIKVNNRKNGSNNNPKHSSPSSGKGHKSPKRHR